MKTLIKSGALTALLAITLIFASCVSAPGKYKKISRNLYDQGIKTAGQLTKFFLMNNPEADKKYIKNFAELYITEASTEGINSDCAFVQMCLETGFLRFGNLVTAEMHNYCGLGAMDAEHPGEVFANEKEGVRAHIQHLHAYATTEDIELVNTCIDRRYKYVRPRGKAPDINGLSGTWAMDPNYAVKLEQMLQRLEKVR